MYRLFMSYQGLLSGRDVLSNAAGEHAGLTPSLLFRTMQPILIKQNAGNAERAPWFEIHPSGDGTDLLICRNSHVSFINKTPFDVVSILWRVMQADFKINFV